MSAARFRRLALSHADLASRLPREMLEARQWVSWRTVERDGKLTKVPINPTDGNRASTVDPATWTALDAAMEFHHAEPTSGGVGFVFTPEAGLVGVDLDDAVADGTRATWAESIVSRLPGAYVETSPSGTGLHIITRGSTARSMKTPSVEIYSDRRYFTVTGDRVGTGPSVLPDHTAVIEAILGELSPEHRRLPEIAPSTISASDAEILEHARRASGEKLAVLFDQGAVSEYDGDESRADLALLSQLSFWTGPDPEALDRLFRASALMRPKWDRKDYRDRTITKALSNPRGFYAWDRCGCQSCRGRRRLAEAPRSEAHVGRAADADSPELRRGIEASASPSASNRSPSWPNAPDEAAFSGIAGDWVRLLDPHTEADPAAVLVQFLVAFGNVLNRGPHCLVESDTHGANLFVVLVGETARARKGTSWGHTRRLFELVDETWSRTRVMGGLSSGEGLIHAVRDPVEKTQPIREKGTIVGYEQVMLDPGVTDKRLLVLESELAGPLRVMAREGNTLSPVLRQAWDSGSLRSLSKNNPGVATGAHISLIGHITCDELKADLAKTDMGNGFANRILWTAVRRSKALPDGGNLDDRELSGFACRLARIVEKARLVGRVQRDPDARTEWASAYLDLSEGNPDRLGAVTSRAEAQVTRLSLLYALLAERGSIHVEDLKAALALWRYAERSAGHIFGTTVLEDAEDREDRAVAVIVAGRPGSRVTPRWLANSGPRRYRAQQDLAERRLMRLVSRGWGEWQDPPSGPASGRAFVLKPEAGCGSSENNRTLQASASIAEDGDGSGAESDPALDTAQGEPPADD